MRNFKKVIALVLAVVLMMSTFTVAFAAEKTEAEKLSDMGLLLVTSSTELNMDLTRSIGLAMVLKALGFNQAAADAFVPTTVKFTVDAGKWYDGFAEKGSELKITDGVTLTSFGGSMALTSKMYTTWMLRALGNDSAAAWANTDALALAAGLPAVSAAKTFSKADAAHVMFAALSAKVVGTEVKLIDKLIAAGIVTREAAVAAGLVVGDILIDSAKITGTKTVTAVFNQAVDTTKAIFKVKKGAAVYGTTVAWNEAKTTATLTTVMALPAADYTLEVTGLTTAALTKAFTVVAEAPTTVSVVSTTVALADLAQITFKVANQYGEDMVVNGNAVVLSAFNTTQKKSEVIADVAASLKSELQFTSIKTDLAKLGDVVRVTIAYAGLTAQANLTVAEVATGSALTFGDIVLAKDDVRLNVADGTAKLTYTLLDQFGVATKLSASSVNTAAILTADKIQLISSDTAVISGFATNSDKELVLTVAGAGTATITAIINSSGAVATTKVTVLANEAAKTVSIAAPTTIVAAKDKAFDLVLTIVDQYGSPVTSVTGLTATATFTTDAASPLATSGDIALNLTAVNKEPKLNVDLTASDLGTIVKTTPVKIEIKNAALEVLGTLTFDMEPKAVAFEIKTLTFPGVFEKSATKTMAIADLSVIDQYGRAFTPLAIVVSEVTDTSSVASVALNAITADATNVGTATYKVVVDASATATKEFTVQTIATTDITSYALEDMKPVFISVNAAYNVAPVLVGKTAAGATVVLVTGKVTAVTTSDASIATITAGAVDAVKVGTAVISVWAGATKLASTTVTVTDVASVPATIEYSAKTYVVGAALSTILLIKDQYGVTVTPAAFAAGTVVTGNVAVVAGTGVAAGAGTTSVSFITQNGLIVTADIVVTL